MLKYGKFDVGLIFVGVVFSFKIKFCLDILIIFSIFFNFVS